MTIDKSEVRRSLIAARFGININLRREWDAAICKNILAWRRSNSFKTLAVYWPMRGEPDVRDTYAELVACGVQLALPVIMASDSALKFVAWTPGDVLIKDEMGVSVPKNAVTETKPDALLIPCVGFNAAGFRLGYGGGFYDRTLASSPRPLAIGIAYSCANASFAVAPHDIALDAIITEKPANLIR